MADRRNARGATGQRPAVLLLLLLLASSASPPPTLRPGLWSQYATPGVATIDGERKQSLPIDPPSPEQMCMSAAQAAMPAVWMTGQMAGDCTITRATLAGGKVDIEAQCANPDAKASPGTLKMTGRWQSDRFDVDFATQTHADGQTFGFSGHIAAHRIGDCAEGAALRQ